MKADSLSQRKKRRPSHIVVFGIGWLAAILTSALCGCNRHPPPAAREPAAPIASPLQALAAQPAPIRAASAPSGDTPATTELVISGAPPPDDGRGMGVVVATRLNLRAHASTSERILDTFRCGDIIDITGRDGAWYAVKSGELAGYSHSSYIFRIGPGGLRPHCTRGVAARREPDQPLNGRAERHKRAAKHAPDADSAGPAPDGELPIAEEIPRKAATAPAAAPASAEHAPPDAGTPALGPAPAAASVPAPPPIDRGPAQIVFAQDSSQVSPSRFPHQLHQGKFPCSKCHHPVSGSSGHLSRINGIESNNNKRCRSCHIDGSGNVKLAAEDAMHHTCRDCHAALGPSQAPRAPRKCPECHKP